jgi:hypothetical protein
MRGQTASSLHLSAETYDKFQAAAGGEAVTDVEYYEAPAPLEIYKEPETEVQTVAPGVADAGVADACLCPIGTRSVNVAGLGEHKKSNSHLHGPDGGPCVSSCDACMRVQGGDRLPCCVMLGPQQPGKCGKEQKGPFV